MTIDVLSHFLAITKAHFFKYVDKNKLIQNEFFINLCVKRKCSFNRGIKEEEEKLTEIILVFFKILFIFNLLKI